MGGDDHDGKVRVGRLGVTSCRCVLRVVPWFPARSGTASGMLLEKGEHRGELQLTNQFPACNSLNVTRSDSDPGFGKSGRKNMGS